MEKKERGRARQSEGTKERKTDSAGKRELVWIV